MRRDQDTDDGLAGCSRCIIIVELSQVSDCCLEFKVVVEVMTTHHNSLMVVIMAKAQQ
jgi:hypothetical protein